MHYEQIADSSAWPAKLLFFCETPASEGGSTPIIVSHKVTQSLWMQCPDFMQKLEEQGLLYIKVLPMEKDPSYISLQGWPLVFGTTDMKEAEERLVVALSLRHSVLFFCFSTCTVPLSELNVNTAALANYLFGSYTLPVLIASQCSNQATSFLDLPLVGYKAAGEIT